ncbi:MAG: hypothetical protein OJF61_000889 [Rhodanobacteraceae bacterium]|nr:MAG: hypothetical protein OJF61_000889 [Rhodanobacteraceae bacterium]
MNVVGNRARCASGRNTYAPESRWRRHHQPETRRFGEACHLP